MPKTILFKYYQSKFGELIIGSFEGKLCLCDWRHRKMRTNIDLRIQRYFGAQYIENNTEIIDKTIFQLEEYGNGLRTNFDVELSLAGTDFQKSVWNELINIPYGKTESYLGLSRKMGNEKAIRAVATANGANAISIIIPCHRVIGTNGSLVGYAGGLAAKQKLLSLENKINEQQLSLF